MKNDYETGNNGTNVPEITVVIPTYNEAGNIGRIVPAIFEANPGLDIEILVVDDDSKDGTPQIARDAGANVIVRTEERGLATAVIRGLRDAEAPMAMVMDADFQHPPFMVTKMVERARSKDAQVVVGSRYVEGGTDGSFTAARKMMSRGARAMAQVGIPDLRKHKVTDPMSGLFLIQKDAVDLDKLQPQGYKILLEILGRNPVERVAEVGYEFGVRDAGESKLGARVMVDYIAHLLRLSRDHPENRRVGKFAAVGISGIGVNLGVAALLLAYTNWAFWMQSALAIEVSIISNFLLNDYFTFRDRRHDHILQRMLKFNSVSLITMGTQLATALFMHEVVGLHELVSQAVGIGVGFFGNYLLNLKWTYAGDRKA